MKRIPWRLETALIGTIGEGHDFEFYPLTKELSFVRSDDDQSTHRIDFYDGLAPSVIVDGEDRTLDVIRALGDVIKRASRVAVHYELAACATLRAGEDERGEVDLAYMKAAETMRKYADALHALASWYAFQMDLAERGVFAADH